jgi:outer membrane protein OmpA-like peptidoglycan-associated protein
MYRQENGTPQSNYTMDRAKNQRSESAFCPERYRASLTIRTSAPKLGGESLPRRRKMKRYPIALLIVFVTFATAASPAFTAPDEYDDSQSHPLRILAYLVHPAVFLVEWTVFRPFHYLVSATEAQEAFFGHTPHPPVLSEPQPLSKSATSRRTAMNDVPGTQPQTVAAAGEAEPAERVKVVEVPVERTIIKEVPKVVEIEKFVFPAIAFRFDSAELTELGRGQVYLAAQRLKENPELTVVIEGHTDYVGSDEYNQRLGLRRAQTVIRELATQGIEANRMSAASVGETRPAITQQTDWARAVNRRVEFQVNER